MTRTIAVPAWEMLRVLDYQRFEAGEKVEWIDTIFEMLDEQEGNDGYKVFQVGWEPRTIGDWELARVEIPKRCYGRLHHVLGTGVCDLDRDPGWGPITTLRHRGKMWMSDTRAEILEHAPLLNRLWWLESTEPRVLINGLGLGMAVNAALKRGAEHVDVVEIDQDVIDIIGPNFEGQPVTIHHADALTMKWPTGTKWDLAWHDIWPTIDQDNLPQMQRLHRMYGGRTDWQGSWQEEGCRAQRKRDEEVA